MFRDLIAVAVVVDTEEGIEAAFEEVVVTAPTVVRAGGKLSFISAMPKQMTELAFRGRGRGY